MTFLPENIFAKIITGEIPCDKVWENERILAFKDINPQAKIHILIMFHDISERVAKYQEIERLSQRIQKLNEELKSKNKIFKKSISSKNKNKF